MLLRKKLLSQAVSATLLTAVAYPAYSEPENLEQMVVTATRTPTPINNIGSSVSVITAADIQTRQYQTLADALKHVPGLRVVETGGRGSQTSVFARGTNSNHTLVMVDGIEINDPSSPTGAFDFAHFLLDDIASIEIVRGAQSVLYGADAIGAVIQIRTRKGQGKLKTRAKFEAGNKSTHHETLAVSGSQAGFHYSLTGGIFESDGDSIATEKRLPAGESQDDDGYKNKVVSAQLGWSNDDTVETNFFARHIESDNEIDGFLSNDFDAYNTNRQTYLGAEFKGRFLTGMWQPTLLLTHTNIERHNHNRRQNPLQDADRSRYLGEKNKLSLQNDLHLSDKHLLTAGYEYEKERLDASGESIYGSEYGDFVLNQSSDASRANRAIYLQDQIAVTDRLNATIGVRHDNTDDFTSENTYRLTANYAMTDNSRIRVAHGTGFRAPSLYELYGFTPSNYGSAYYGNPDLDAETSKNWEIGLDQFWFNQRLSSSLTVFKNDIDDLITTEYSGADSTSINQNEADIHGLEAFFSLAATSNIDLNLSYTFTRTKDDDDRELLRRPKHQASLDVEYRVTPKLTLTTSLAYTGSRKDAGRVRMGGYSTLDFTAEYQVSNSTRLFGRVENLTDKEYEAAYGFQGTGITGIVGVELSNY